MRTAWCFVLPTGGTGGMEGSAAVQQAVQSSIDIPTFVLWLYSAACSVRCAVCSVQCEACSHLTMHCTLTTLDITRPKYHTNGLSFPIHSLSSGVLWDPWTERQNSSFPSYPSLSQTATSISIMIDGWAM